MATASRTDFTEYCLRALGEPVVEINIDDSQVEDRIDEAIEYWRQYHYDGIERVYLKQQVTASRITITTNNGSSFPLNAKITGAQSGATAIITKEAKIPTDGGDFLTSDGNTLIVMKVTGDFINGEDVSDGTTTATLAASNAVTKGMYDNRYVDLPDAVYGIHRVIPFTGTTSSKNLFDLQYQLRLNDLYDLTSVSLIYYKQVMSHIALLDMELNGHPLYRFNRMQGRLFLDINWETDTALGEVIVVECYRALDPATWTKIWNEPWLKHYATALIKRQWATNIKKFSGIALPGGVTLDGNQLYDEAQNEIAALEEELINKSAPLEFFLG